jgi:signal transduction histidine kinase
VPPDQPLTVSFAGCGGRELLCAALAERRVIAMRHSLRKPPAPRLKINRAIRAWHRPCRNPSLKRWSLAFETLACSREVVCFRFDATGTVRRILVREPESIHSLLAELTGSSLQDLLGRRTSSLLLAACSRSQTSGHSEELGCALDSSQGLRWFFGTVKYCANDNQTRPFFHLTLQHASQRSRLNVEQCEVESLTDSALDLAGIGRWQADLQTGSFRCSDSFLRILKASGHPRERANEFLWSVTHACYETATETHETFATHTLEQDIQFRLPSGDVQTIRACTAYRPADAGLPYQFTGVVQEVTARRAEQSRLVALSHELTERAHSEEALRRLSQDLMRARDLERRNIARELHDTAGQNLAALKMAVGRIAAFLPTSTVLTNDCLNLADDVARQIRTLSYLLHPPMLDEVGLASALRLYVRGFSDRSRIEVCLTISPTFGRLSPRAEIALFRVVQEALTNIYRHSGSQTARINLLRNLGNVHLEVQDDGRGLTGSAGYIKAGAPGVGIAGMRERLRELNGVLEMESAPGCGTIVRAIIPDSSSYPDPRFSPPA